ncbi:Retrovirus-related Pol polyprotein from transposon RE2 [Vitis vinifera]|uniref:Retrovirus-related Pol polyprotein from transposon RE2 n=1 Tax=Vitis vinifera TaxID=29760 RepID=A0A438JBE9_VITVI|nr:Retrovirus-related Pol polyprotein from transposon RE2 [Vitis vinifera]
MDSQATPEHYLTQFWKQWLEADLSSWMLRVIESLVYIYVYGGVPNRINKGVQKFFMVSEPVSETLIPSGQISLAISHSDHLSLWPSLIPVISPYSQSQGRKRFPVGLIIIRKHSPPATFPANFPATVFSTPQGAPGGDLQFVPKHRNQKPIHAPSTRAFSGRRLASHASEREGAPARASFGVLLLPWALRSVFPASSSYFFSTPIPARALGSVLLPFRSMTKYGMASSQWSQSVLLFICGKGKDEYLTGEAAMPETTEPGFRKWKIENSMIMSWLINSMNNDIGENFLLFGTAKDIWDAAKETYSSSENTSELFQVESALHDFRQGEQSVTQYYNTLTRPNHGIKPLPSLREAFSEIRREESRKKVMMGSKEQPAPTLDGSALAARSFNSSGGDRQKRDRPWCDYCKKPGHYKEACWKLHGKPADWKPKPRSDRDGRAHVAANSESTSVPEPSPFNKEQMEMLQKLLSQVGSGSTTGIALTASQGGMKPWIVDTGASDHMTGDATILQNYKPSNGHSSVHIADGSKSKIAGTGSIKLTKDLYLDSVLHVPNLDCNLLSISKLARDLQCVTKFYPNSCVFQDLKSGKMIGSAELCSGLYLLSCGQFSNQVSQASCVQSQSMLESFNSVSNSKVNKIVRL